MSCLDFKKIFRCCAFKWAICATILFVILIIFSQRCNLFFANNHHLFDGLGKIFGIFTPIAIAFVGFAQYKLAKEKEESLKYKIESDEKKLIRENWEELEKIMSLVGDTRLKRFPIVNISHDNDISLPHFITEVMRRFDLLRNKIDMLPIGNNLKNLIHETRSELMKIYEKIIQPIMSNNYLLLYERDEGKKTNMRKEIKEPEKNLELSLDKIINIFNTDNNHEDYYTKLKNLFKESLNK